MKTASLFGLAVGLSALASPTPTQAVSLTLEPSAQTLKIGEPVTVDVRISDLGNSSAPSLSAFDLNVTFDPSTFAFQGLTFGDSALGDLLDPSGLATLLGFVGFSEAAPGTVNLFETSFEPLSVLDGQPDSFTLATLAFEAVAPGSSALELSVNFLGDSLGDRLPVTLAMGSRLQAVPEPSLGGFGLLLTLGFVGLSRRSFGKR